MPGMQEENEAKEKVEQEEQRKKRVEGFGVPEDPLEEPVLPDTQRPKYRPNQTDIIMERAMELPFEIKAHEAKIFALTQKEDYIKKRSAELREGNYLNVLMEKTKGQLRYPDLQSQEKETLNILQASNLWKQIKEDVYCQVSKETLTHPPGEKKEKAYTNEKTRQAETTKRLYLHPEIKELNQKILKQVNEEKEEGKSVYVNEKAREIEVNRRLQENAEYKILKDEQRKTIAEISRTKSDIYCLRGEYKSIEIVTELMKIKLRII